MVATAPYLIGLWVLPDPDAETQSPPKAAAAPSWTTLVSKNAAEAQARQHALERSESFDSAASLPTSASSQGTTPTAAGAAAAPPPPFHQFQSLSVAAQAGEPTALVCQSACLES